MQSTFRAVIMSDSGREPVSSFSSFNSDYDDRYAADNVAILSHNGEAKEPETNQLMSPTRRFCFVGSLLLCLFAVMSFIWLIPCTEEGTCPAPADRIKTHNWLSKYTNIELKGAANVVAGARKFENNLIFLYRGDAFFPGSRPGNTKQNGIISLVGSSGAIAWYDEIHNEPMTIDCTLIDVDLNKQPDCLVLDEYGELGVINSISGQWYWKYKERSAHKIDESDFPVILPDLDGDGVLELLIVTCDDLLRRTKMLVSQKSDGQVIPKAPRNFLRLMSGRTGAPIGEGFEVHDCDLLRNLHLDGSTPIVHYNCVSNNTESHHSKSIGELFALITNKSLLGVKMTPTSEKKISQHHHSGLHRDKEAQRNIYSLSGRELVVENRGKCPENCNVTFILSDGRYGKVKVLRNFTEPGMYGMVPVQWHFKNSEPEMSGFVMKFWKWSQLETTVRNTSKSSGDIAKTDSTPPKHKEKKKTEVSPSAKDNDMRSKKAGGNPQQNHHIKNKTISGQWNRVHTVYPDFAEYHQFEHLIHKRESYTLPGISQTNTTPQKNYGNGAQTLNLNTYKIEMITETVILVLFIGADTRIENTSQSNIIQFCHSDTNEKLCQPDLNNQENSILIADLDQDGSQELVSFTSTYIEDSGDSTDYKLVTYVRLIRIQAELPDIFPKGKGY